ncbi:MAG: hypothetical protein HY287_05270 [Planctomycetes bacterium]|nr:hypothetical protein [Planctomycetota bacterium]MBI3833722.1 hypothetical protein [Planctomycetota bacterium]
MQLNRKQAANAARLILIPLSILQSHCGSSFDGGGLPVPPSTLGSSVTPSTPTVIEAGANDVLALAEKVDMSAQPQVISGNLSDASDIDVYDLGPVSAGDHVKVAVSVSNGLRGAIALLDENGDSLLINDHRNVYMGKNGPFIDLILRRDSRSCLIAMTSTPGFNSSGGYELTVSTTPVGQVPAPRPDDIILDFSAGRSVQIGTRPPIDVPAFNAASIDPSFQGTTDEMIAEIVSRVRQHFKGYNVRILSTSEGAQASTRMSRIHFGTFDAALLGVAATVDEYNSEVAQQAIVFTDTFKAFMVLRPSASEMAQALANVASHEIGHLEGLVHTANPPDIMDVTASLRQLLQDQEFQDSPLYSDVFPIGHQDSVQYLLDSVGGDAAVAQKNIERLTSRERFGARSLSGQPARQELYFSSCALGPERGHPRDSN